jgi:TRAP-type C4-dicarboxylate transport system permease small subunit
MRDFGPFLGLPLWLWLFVLPTVLVGLAGVFSRQSEPVLRPIWRLLDRIYMAAGVIAAFGMVSILVIIVFQMVARWLSFTFPGSTDYAGYAMAATSFFALAYTLTRGGHIRVSIFLGLNRFTEFWLNALAMLIGAFIATFLARYAIKSIGFSVMLNDRTQGQDQVPEWLLTTLAMLNTWPGNWGDLWATSGAEWVFTPLWLPQLSMGIGTILLAVALWDHLSRLLVTRESAISSETVE